MVLPCGATQPLQGHIETLFPTPQSHRNLSQLPNFAFSVPLAYFLQSQQEELPDPERGLARERAAQLIQHALIMFPSGELAAGIPGWLLVPSCVTESRIGSHPRAMLGIHRVAQVGPAFATREK